MALGISLAKLNTYTPGDSPVYDVPGNGLARSGHRFSGGRSPVDVDRDRHVQLSVDVLEPPLRRGHRLSARIVGHTAQHAQSGTGAVGVLTAATPTAPVSTSVTSESLSKIASSAVLLFVVIDIPQTPVGSISIVKNVGK